MNSISQWKLLLQNKGPVNLRNKNMSQNENSTGCRTVNVCAAIVSKELSFSLLSPCLKHLGSLS